MVSNVQLETNKYHAIENKKLNYWYIDQPYINKNKNNINKNVPLLFCVLWAPIILWINISSSLILFG